MKKKIEKRKFSLFSFANTYYKFIYEFKSKISILF